MQRYCIAVLLVSIAFVAFAAAAADAEKQAASTTNVAPAAAQPTAEQKLLAMDSPVATYAFDKKGFVAAAAGYSKYGYTHRKSKHSKGHYDDHKYGHEYKPKPHTPSPPPPKPSPPTPYKYEENYDGYDEYDSATKVCLQEIKRVPLVYPDAAVNETTEYKFQSFFTCCGKLEDKDYANDGVVPDAHEIISGPVTPIGYCNWTATAAGKAKTGSKYSGDIVGRADAVCVITVASECVKPLKPGFTWSTDITPNHTYWVQVDAALGTKAFGFGVYSADSDSKASTSAGAEPAAAKPAYSYDNEYEYVPSPYPINAVRGKVQHFSTMLESVNRVIKGGTMHFTAGFIDSNGKVLCPAGLNTTVTRPSPSTGLIPLVKCGQYSLKLWAAPSGPYYGYDGKYNDPYESYGYYKDDGYYYKHPSPPPAPKSPPPAPKSPPPPYYKDDGYYYKDPEEYYYKDGSYYKGDYSPPSPPRSPPSPHYYKEPEYYKGEHTYYKGEHTYHREPEYHHKGKHSYHHKVHEPESYYKPTPPTPGPPKPYYKEYKESYYKPTPPTPGPPAPYYDEYKEYKEYSPEEYYYKSGSPPGYYKEYKEYNPYATEYKTGYKGGNTDYVGYYKSAYKGKGYDYDGADSKYYYKGDTKYEYKDGAYYKAKY